MSYNPNADAESDHRLRESQQNDPGLEGVVDFVAEILEEIVNQTEEAEVEEEEDDDESSIIKSFSTKNPPQITIKKYLYRIMKYSKPEPSTIIIALIYIDKVCENSNLQLSMRNIHRLILTSFVLAIKYNEDDFYSNGYYAKVGGIKQKELNELEYNILLLLEFSVFIDTETYEKYQSQLSDFEI